MKKIRVCLMVFLIMLGLTACGKPASANSLINEAKLKHGDATVVSKTKNADGYTIVLHDNLQNFDYTVSSYMRSETLDGAELWSLPATSDSFEYELTEKIKTDEQANINNIETKYSVSFSAGGMYPTVTGNDPDSAKQAAFEIADIYQRNNMKNRLDGLEIIAVAPDTYYFDRTGYYDRTDEMMGYVTLPNFEWSGRDQWKIDQYTEVAKQLDPGAVYLRDERKIFSDTGYNLEEVTLTGDCPKFEDAPVTYYYFKASDGGEFYVADFCINNHYRPSEFFEANNYNNRVYP